jgi:FecR protein
MKNKVLLFIVGLNLTFNYIESTFAQAIVTDIDGGLLQVIAPDGAQRTVSEGDRLEVGTKLTVPNKVTITLSYETGMDVLQLIYGELRSFLSVDKPAMTSDQAPATKFIIKTPTAVCGVRGTDFSVLSIAGATDVWTLEGEVAVAKDLVSYKAGNIASLKKGEFFEKIRPTQNFKKIIVKKFKRDAFLKDFSLKHPRAAKLRDRAKLRRAKHFETKNRR